MLLKSLDRIAIFLVVLLFASFSPANAQEQGRIYTIAGITVEGNRFADTETIIAISGLRVGRQVNLDGDEQLQKAVKNLWLRRQFADVEIIVDRISPVGVFLIIKVEEFPRLNEINIMFNEKLTDDEVRKASGKIKGDIVSKYDLYLVEKKIKEFYAEEGLAFAKVDAKMADTEREGYVNLVVEVDEGAEFNVESINFNGNEAFDDGDLAGAFEETQTKYWWEFWESSKFDQEEYEKDKEHLINFYQREGFADAQIISDSLYYDEENEQVHIYISVSEGQRVYIRNIDFEGNTVYPDDVLARRLDFREGEPYDMERFEMNLHGNEDQTDVSSLYLDNGYLAARIDKSEKRVAPDTVDVTIQIFENNRWTIRKVHIEGNTKTMDKVIRRELYTRPGDYFDRSAIIRSVRALGMMNYFNPEGLKPDVRPVDNTSVDVVYKVEERSTDTFNASIGFAGTFGLTGSIGFTFNNFAISEPFTGGGGQIFNFNWEFGQWNRYRTFSLGFSEPWLFDEPTTVGFNIFDTDINYGYKLRRTGVAINFGRRFKWPDDYWRGDWSVRFQRNDVGTMGARYWRPGINTEITLGQTFSRISLDNMFFPSRGSRFSWSNNFAMGAIGLGTTDYFKSEIDYEMYTPLLRIEDQNRVALYLSSKIGYINGFQSDTTISPIELYYMGGNGLSGFGVTPMRGYDDRTIGPVNGGKVLSRYIAELRFAISLDPMPIFFYGFAEAGNVWSALKQTDPFDLKRSAGVGVQMLLNPIGIVGFSYGYGFDPVPGTEGPGGWKFLFHLGQQR
ncbi:MAG: outer membrane protein assembly factor BamA [Candidatus Kapaibacterium sp.]